MHFLFYYLQFLLNSASIVKMTNIKKLIQSPLFIYSLFAFVLFCWPFYTSPITDGDVDNWVPETYALSQEWNFLTAQNDQAHGPLLIWTGAISMAIFGYNLFAINFFNMICGVLGVFLLYFFSFQLWKDKRVSHLSCVIFLTSLAPVYFSKTPMYDWPATIFLFGFFVFYSLSILKNRIDYYFLSYIFLAVASLSRFSICLGLAGIFVVGCHFIFKRSFLYLIRDGSFVVISILLTYLPWLIGQVSIEGSHFISDFLVDNFRRYFKSNRVNATFRFDFYGLPLYVFIGLLPYSFMATISFFNKSFFQRLKTDQTYQLLCLGFLPALTLFSFSGHTKLARYIAYVFPCIILLFSHSLIYVDLNKKTFKKACQRWAVIFMALLSLLLIQQGFQFSTHSQDAFYFILNCIFLLFSLLGLLLFFITKKTHYFYEKPMTILCSLGFIYFIFFLVLVLITPETPFLNEVKQDLLNKLP